MCGIFGIVFGKSNPELGKIMVEAGRRLVYRGYDSVGVGVMDGKRTDLRKDAGTIEQVSREYRFEELSGERGIIQLRWATFGRPSKRNSQPHYDCDGDMIGAHNGNIVNCTQLRNQYMKEGHAVKGWNDGEMMVHTVEKYYDQYGRDLNDALIRADADLHGDYAFVITTVHANEMYAVKRGSSLYLGVGDGFICCSSDLPSILPLTKMIMPLRDGEFVRFDESSFTLFSLKDGSEIDRIPEESELDPEEANKGGFEHYMAKEIYDQPKRVEMLMETLDESDFVDSFIEKIMEAKRIFIVACGSSFNASVTGSYFFNKFAGVPVMPVIAGQFIDNFGQSIGEEDCVIFISQSGETKDVINGLNFLRKLKKGTLLGVLNVLGSTLMLNTDVYLPLVCDLEISVPATKTFLNQVVLLYYVALELGRKNGMLKKKRYETLKRELRTLPGILRKTLARVDPQCKTLVKDLEGISDCYCLGYGVSHGIALEGALKIKEITYIHCEGMYSSEFKHGPLSIVSKGYPVLFITTPEDTYMIVSHMNEVSCRKGNVIVISEDSRSLRANSDHFLATPRAGTNLSPIVNVIPLQLLSYYWALAGGVDPDYPRNLSKTLTVD